MKEEKGGFNVKKGLRRMYITFLTPVIITFIVVYLYPVFRTFQMSLYEIPGINAPKNIWKYVGLGNYRELMERQLFKVACQNALLIFICGGIIVFTISLFFAWVLHKGMFMGSFWCNMIYLPTVITPVAMVVVWTQYAFNNRFGLLKNIFDAVGLHSIANIPWTSTKYAFWAMLIAYCFGCIGGNLIVYMASMKKIPGELFEAAFMDGASEGKIFYKITLPLIRDNIKTQITFWTLGCIGFFLWSRVFSVVPSDPTTITPSSYMFDQIFGSAVNANTVAAPLNVGMGTAIGVILCIVTVIAFAIINLVFSKENYEM